MANKKTEAVAAPAVKEGAAAPRRGRKPAAKPKGKPGRKAAPKKAHTPAPQVMFQLDGVEYDAMALMERARAAYRATHKTGIHTCKVYVKPQEGMVYYVINKEEGKFPL